MQKRAMFFLARFSALLYVATTIEGGHRDCRIARATEGDTAKMTFFISPEISLSTDPFFAYVIREKDTTNTLQCERRKPLSNISCEILKLQVQTEGIVNSSLTIVFKNVSQDIQGTYRMHAHFNDSWDIVSCNLTVKAGVNSTDRSTKGSSTITVVAVIVSLVIFSAIIGIVVLCYRRPGLRKYPGGLCCERQRSKDNAPQVPETLDEFRVESMESAMPLLTPGPDNQPSDDLNIEPSENADQGETTTQSDGACADQQRLRKEDKTDSLKRSNRKLSEVSKTTRNSKASLQRAELPDSENADQGETTTQSDGACADQQRLRKKDKTDSLKRSNRKLSEVSKTTRNSKASLQPAELPEWVFKNMTKKEAQDMLLSEGKEDFTFLVRTEKKMYISVRFEKNRVEKYGIHHSRTGYWIEKQDTFPELNDLVDHYRKVAGFFAETRTLGKRIDANLTTT
ncbi:uncharacterized protein [Littorina saxatilis]|uniref:uncharacterized protein n=1 Tax=Littorina saxatilis TaxID=31220 RepID=UPI0038B4A169